MCAIYSPSSAAAAAAPTHRHSQHSTICDFMHAQAHTHTHLSMPHILYLIFYSTSFYYFSSTHLTHMRRFSVAQMAEKVEKWWWNGKKNKPNTHTCEELRFVDWLGWKFNYIIIIFIVVGGLAAGRNTRVWVKEQLKSTLAFPRPVPLFFLAVLRASASKVVATFNSNK